MMIKTYRMTILGMLIISLILSGCDGATTTPPTSTPFVQNQPVEPQSTPTTAAEEVIAPTQAASASSSVDGLVWDDMDHDGLQDLQEPGVPNVAVSLLTDTRTVAGSTVTNGNGAYQFKDLVPGNYFVNLVLPSGYTFAPQDQGMNELVDSDNDPATSETVPVSLVAGENGLVFTSGIYSPSAAVLPESGTVKPPPAEVNVCVPGTYSLGGISTVTISQLAPGYCLHAYLWNHAFAIGRIPDAAGQVLSAVTFLEFFYQASFVYSYAAPGETNSVQVCYAVPTGMQAQIYFFDHYGPRFGHPHAGQPSWVPLETTVQNGVACAAAQTSGAYALIGK